MEPGLAQCPYCHAPVRARDLRKTGNTLKGVGVLCILAAAALSVSQEWLGSKGLNSGTVVYLFWLLFISGWIIAGIGGLLSSGKPIQMPPGDSDGTGGVPSEPYPYTEDPDTAFMEQPSYTGERGTGVILRFEDGYCLHVQDTVLTHRLAGQWEGKTVAVVQGANAEYHHVLGTDLVRIVPTT